MSTKKYKNQTFTLIATHPHVSKAGTPTVFLEWESFCRACGAAYRLTTTRAFREPRLRCKPCIAVRKVTT